ncbi:unnamed protein product [Orchesella dallaii]|uniref:Uncharacterized protein n=1 Tax=Orchesella dallaii TaxID=48710 RepID=A0ABP1PZ35_9HEXA
MGSMSESLFAWVATLPPYSNRNANPRSEDFTDGRMLASLLKDVIDPEYFKDLNSESSPLIQVMKKMKQYLEEQVGHSLPSTLLPNIPRIMTTGDLNEISRLLQLLLGCAVNSPRKEDFVKRIQTMATSVQTEIVTAIQEIMEARSEGQSSSADVIEIQLQRAREEISGLQDNKEQLSQRCHELNQKIKQMNVEKTALLAENERLQAQIAGDLKDPESVHMSIRIHEENRREIEQLRERNFELEGQVDDYKVKNQVLQQQITEVHAEVASKRKAEEEVVRLKDEMDSLRELAAKAAGLEKQLKLYQKRMEEMGDLKQNLKLLEEKNLELMKTNFALSDENKKIQSYKQQLDNLKKDLTETQQQLSQETQNALKANFDCGKMREKLETTHRHVETLQEDKSRLSDMVEELRLNGLGGTSSDGIHLITADASVDSIELLPPLIRQKLVRLELENRKLQEELKTAIENGPSNEGSKILVEQLRKHEKELDEELLAKNQEILDVKANYEDQLKRLEAILGTKDEELKKKEAQYKKCMEKAKSVITTLEPTAAPGLDMGKAEEQEKARAVREVEEKLLNSMFYNYSLTRVRDNVEARNTTLLKAQRMRASRRRSDL